MRKHIKECRNICNNAGLSVLGIEFRGKHLAVRCTEGRIFMPCTPSDYRWRHNAKSLARRTYAACQG